MVSALKKNDYKNLVKFLKAVTVKDTEKCCKYVTKLAINFDRGKIIIRK